jgi:hypothetical protein
MNNLDLFICAHKEYDDIGLDNSSYKIISNRTIKNNSKLDLIQTDAKLDDRMWSELSSIYYIWKNVKIEENVGICHYRRYFNFFNDVPNIIDKPILPIQRVENMTNLQAYGICHNAEDLKTVSQIATSMFPEYKKAIDYTLSSNLSYTCNMFIMDTKLFNDYCNFIFTILMEFDKNVLMINNDFEKMLYRIRTMSDKYLKTFDPCDNILYQSRLYGFLAERLTNAFFTKYKNDNGDDSIKELKVINKY